MLDLAWISAIIVVLVLTQSNLAQSVLSHSLSHAERRIQGHI